jgi:hypothetical protein
VVGGEVEGAGMSTLPMGTWAASESRCGQRVRSYWKEKQANFKLSKRTSWPRDARTAAANLARSA